jgi:hypothetical protein
MRLLTQAFAWRLDNQVTVAAELNKRGPSGG